MEMVAAAKMRKAVAKVLASRSYADLAWQTVLHLLKKVDTSSHPFFAERTEIKNIGVVLVSTNRGLCGSFNGQLVDKTQELIGERWPQASVEIISLGKKGSEEARRRGLALVADFTKQDITQDSTEIRPIAKLAIQDFLAGKYDKVFVAYTDYYSALKQLPHLKQLLPLEAGLDDSLGHVAHEENKVAGEMKADDFAEFLFEPSQADLLNAFLPRLIEVSLYQAVLESEASEHSARMLAMRNASEAAEDMISDLTLAYNKARQAGITAEIAEIAAGAAALG